jgi:hypothetical protein
VTAQIERSRGKSRASDTRAARLLFLRKRKSIRDLATSQECQFRTSEVRQEEDDAFTMPGEIYLILSQTRSELDVIDFPRPFPED